MRRAVPFNRSDSDRAGIPQRLAYSTTVLRWLPYQGCAAKDGGDELGSSSADIYAMRSAMLPITQYSGDFYYNPSNVDWEAMLQYKRERNEYEKYFYSDFYVLTPYNGINDTENWTAYMYFNPNTDSGVISAFRAVDCEQSQCIVKIKGVNPNHYYTIRDVDGYNSVQRVKGSALMQGIPLKAKTARTALIRNGEYLELTDKITANAGKAAQVRWSFPTQASAAVTQDGIELTREGVTVILKAQAGDCAVEYGIWTNDPKKADFPTPFCEFEEVREGEYYCGFKVTVPAGKTCDIITTIKKK
jgi:hypothetical protein